MFAGVGKPRRPPSAESPAGHERHHAVQANRKQLLPRRQRPQHGKFSLTTRLRAAPCNNPSQTLSTSAVLGMRSIRDIWYKRIRPQSIYITTPISRPVLRFPCWRHPHGLSCHRQRKSARTNSHRNRKARDSSVPRSSPHGRLEARDVPALLHPAISTPAYSGDTFPDRTISHLS